MKPPRIRFRFPWRSRATIDHQVDAELAFHLDTRTAELVASGMVETDARREAVREFGDLERTRAYCREQDSGLERADQRRERFDELAGNIRYALRSLRRSPGFTAVTLTTLALSIGANTAIFSVANAILLAPLPYGDPAQLVSIYENNTRSGNRQSDISAADIVDYRAAQTSLTDIGILSRGGAIVRTAADDPVALQHLRVSANMFRVLRANPERGRTFSDGEDSSPAAPVVILTHDAWVRLFNSDTSVIGRTMFVNDEAVTLVGIMPKGFGLGYAEDLYTPLDLEPQLRDPNRARKFHWLYAIGRTKQGLTSDVVDADLNGIARTLEKENPGVNDGHLVSVIPMQTALAGTARRATFLLLGAAVVVLLVACANLINMMLARAAARAQELTIRTAIGAGRRHLIAQLVTESVVLATIGGAIGLLVGISATSLIVRISPAALPVLAKPSVDWRVMTFAVLTSLLAGVVVGIVPALRVSRVDVAQSLRRGGRGGDRHGNTLRGMLVVSQTSMAVVLLVVGGLLARSLQNLQRVDLGFDPEHAIVGAPIVRGAKYTTKESYNAFYDAMFERLRSTPGVVAVGAAAGVPLLGGSGCALVIDGREAPKGPLPDVRCSAARGDYYKALGIPILRGRSFGAMDLPDGPHVVMINAALAATFFPGEDPIGKRIRLGPDPATPWETIVGVTGDVRQFNLESDPLPAAMEYDAQQGWGTLGIVIRMDGGDPMRVAPAFRAAVHATDPSLALRMLRTMDEVVGLQLAQRKLTMTLIAGFALLTLVLSGVGIYGVLAFGVTARTREYGIRRALGATGASVRSSVLRGGLGWAAGGLGIGAAAAFVVARSLRTMFFNVAPFDAPTFIVVSGVLLAVAVLACLIPARRAVGVDPLIAMRSE